MSFNFDAKIADWRTQLLDTTRRNPLIHFRSGKTGGIDLLHPKHQAYWNRIVVDGAGFLFAWKYQLLGKAPETNAASESKPEAEQLEAAKVETARCLTSNRLQPNHILTAMTDKVLGNRLTRLSMNAHEDETEQGIVTLYAVFGFLHWYEADSSNEVVRSPLLLAPIRLSRESIEAPWKIEPEGGDILRNDSLAERLRSDFKLQLPAVNQDDAEADFLERYLATTRSAIKHQPRWQIVAAPAIGVFNFQKLTMWEDLAKSAERIKTHPLCRSLAGDPTVSLVDSAPTVSAEELDEKVSPADVVQILDADSSQQEAIEAVKRGANIVLDGPPGTGKSQTIANIIGESLAAGQKVLFFC
jgi:hypothetical protein